MVAKALVIGDMVGQKMINTTPPATAVGSAALVLSCHDVPDDGWGDGKSGPGDRKQHDTRLVAVIKVATLGPNSPRMAWW